VGHQPHAMSRDQWPAWRHVGTGGDQGLGLASRQQRGSEARAGTWRSTRGPRNPRNQWRRIWRAARTPAAGGLCPVTCANGGEGGWSRRGGGGGFRVSARVTS
jgi:hypothetical protein